MFFKKKSFITAAAAALLLFSSCAGDPAPVPPAAESTQPAEGSSAVTEAVSADLVLVHDGQTGFTVVRPDNASEAEAFDVITLKNRLSQRFGAEFGLGNDFLMPGKDASGEYEILVGRCARPESEAFRSSLQEGEYGFRVAGRKIVIAGTDDNLLALALRSFENQVIYNPELLKGGDVILAAGTEHIYRSALAESSPTAILASRDNVIAELEETVCTVPNRGKYTATQGAACDGTYFYIAMTCVYGDGSQTGIVVKTPMDPESKLPTQYSEDMPLDHANDMCYNSAENLLVITNMKGNTVTVVDPETLRMVRQVSLDWLDGAPWAISYNASRGCYVVAAGGLLNMLGSDFRPVGTGISIYGADGYNGQGLDCDDGYLYMPMSPGSTTRDNVIVVYSWDSGYRRTLHLAQSNESETMINRDGKYYIVFNTASGARICRLSFNYSLLYE